MDEAETTRSGSGLFVVTSARFVQAVTNATNCFDQVGVPAQLLADRTDVNVDRPHRLFTDRATYQFGRIVLPPSPFSLYCGVVRGSLVTRGLWLVSLDQNAPMTGINNEQQFILNRFNSHNDKLFPKIKDIKILKLSNCPIMNLKILMILMI